MDPVEQRLIILESKVDMTFAIDSRLRTVEKELEAQNKPQSKSFKEWLSALGPFFSSVALLLIGYWVNDSVKAALAREQLDLDYVKDMRDVMKDFNQSAAQPEADANAIALAMYGKHALGPLVAGLENGDVTHLAAEKGLLLAAVSDRGAVCPRLGDIIDDSSVRYAWQTHKSALRILNQATCASQLSQVAAYAQALGQARANANALASFARRFSNGDAFETDTAASLYDTAVAAVEHLKSSPERQ